MSKVFDRVKESSTSTGAGNITLNGPVPGFQSFANVLSVGDKTFYSIVADDNTWETGIGTYSSANVLERSTVFESSSGGQKVTFSPGPKSVFISYPASKSITKDQSIALSIALG